MILTAAHATAPHAAAATPAPPATIQGKDAMAATRVLYGITTGTSADKLLRGQLAALRRRGWDVVLAATADDRARFAAEREGVPLEEVPMAREISLAADARALVAWVRLLRRRRPDVLNVSTPKAGLLGGVAGALVRVPRRVYVMRGLRLEGAQGVLRAVLWTMERITVLAATDVIVVSASLGAEARRLGLLGRRRTWLVGGGSSNGVPADAVQERAEASRADGLRERLGFAPEDVVVGYVGRLSPDKGVLTLVAALAELDGSPVKGLFIGSAEGVDPAELGPDAVHVPWTDGVWSHYAAMDVLCLPTRREGFPNVVLEAAAAGVPAVTTRATGAVDSVVDGRTGLLVDVDDVAGLRAALVRLASDPELRERLGRAARERARDEFQPETVWAGIAAVMEGAAAPHVTRI